MKLVLALLLVACGGKSPQPVTVSNSAGSPATAEPGSDAGTARVVQRHQNGGVIELTGEHDVAIREAQKEMAAHCGPDAYQIVQEGIETVHPEARPGWTVHYVCR